MKNNTVHGIHAILGILQKHPHVVRELFVQQDKEEQRVQELLDLAKNLNIKPQFTTKHKLDALAGDVHHQGVVAVIAAATTTYTERDLPKLLADLTEPPLLLCLDEVKDPHNLGACLRVANAVGVHAVIAPKNNATGITSVVTKVAAGAAYVTPFIQVTNLVRAMEMLKQEDVWFYGTVVDAPQAIYETKFSGGIALVMGAEDAGLRRLTQEHCDFLMSIPMYGDVASLNVSVATGICLYEIKRQLLRL